MAHEVSRSDERPGSVDADRRNERKLRFVRSVIVFSTGFIALPLVLFSGVDALVHSNGPWRLPLNLVLSGVAGTMLLLLFLGRVRLNRRPRVSPWLYWGSYVLTMVLAALLHDLWFTMLVVSCWWGSAAFAGPRRWGVWATIFFFPLAVLFVVTVAPDHPVSAYFLIVLGTPLMTLFFASGTGVYMRLWDITNEALLNQRARSRLAVSEERLRFARDMHDLLGDSLSELADKSERAERLLSSDASRAAAEMTEVQELARRSLQQVRAAVRSYREADLPEEIDVVRGVLEANGTRVEVTGAKDLVLPQTTATLVAGVVREGATNVLRHSNADVCRISFTLTKEPSSGSTALVVEMFNDRARGGGKGIGKGLVGLRERVSGAGGTLSARATGNGGFLLHVVLSCVPESPAVSEAISFDEGSR